MTSPNYRFARQDLRALECAIVECSRLRDAINTSLDQVELYENCGECKHARFIDGDKVVCVHTNTEWSEDESCSRWQSP